MTTVELRRVAKSFAEGEPAVSDVDLTVDDGEFVVVVGPSGCGKTTVLRMVAGLETPSAGEVRIDGRTVRSAGDGWDATAMLFQESVLYPHLSVRENIAFPLTVNGVHHRVVDRRVDETAGRLGIAGLLDRRPRELSGGQRQRVAMARALVRSPSVLLMDEPMSNLDAKLRGELRAEIRVLQRRLGLTTLYVTHDQVEAMALGDRIVLMDRGRVVQSGPPDELYRHPVDLRVATFIGTPPMNVLPVVVEVDPVDPDRLVVHAAEHRLPVRSDELPFDVQGHLGRPLALGLRPDALVPDPNGDLPVEVVSIEHLGADRLAHAAVDVPSVRGTDAPEVMSGHSTVAVLLRSEDTGPIEVDLWRPIRLRIDWSQAHLFDLDTGRRLGQPPGS